MNCSNDKKIKTYILNYRLISSELIFKDEYEIIFNDSKNMYTYKIAEKNINFSSVINNYYFYKYNTLDVKEKKTIYKYIDCYELDERNEDHENIYDAKYIDFVGVYYTREENYYIKTKTYYIFENEIFSNNFEIYEYIFINNNKLTKDNYDITVVTEILKEKKVIKPHTNDSYALEMSKFFEKYVTPNI